MKPTIVLVHGTFVDGSSWYKVIPILQRDGYPVIAVQNPLTSLPDDVATTKRVIDSQKGSVVVVGHSYGGAVITDAAAGNPNLRGLHADASSYAKKFTAKYEHRVVTGGVGHNLPQEAPQALAKAVVDVDGY